MTVRCRFFSPTHHELTKATFHKTFLTYNSLSTTCVTSVESRLTLTPRESRNSMAAWWGSRQASEARCRKVGTCPNDDRRFSASCDVALRKWAPVEQRNFTLYMIYQIMYILLPFIQLSTLTKCILSGFLSDQNDSNIFLVALEIELY